MERIVVLVEDFINDAKDVIYSTCILISGFLISAFVLITILKVAGGI